MVTFETTYLKWHVYIHKKLLHEYMSINMTHNCQFVGLGEGRF